MKLIKALLFMPLWVIFLWKEEVYEKRKFAGISCIRGINCRSYPDSEYCLRHVYVPNGVRSHGEGEQCQSSVVQVVAGGKSSENYRTGKTIGNGRLGRRRYDEMDIAS